MTFEETMNPLEHAFRKSGTERLERLSNIPDMDMRRALFTEEVSSLGDVAALWAMDVLIWAVVQGDRSAQRVYDGVFQPHCLLDIFDDKRVSRLRELAIEERTYGAYHWLSGSDAVSEKESSFYDGPRMDSPLGVRRADARRAQGKALEKLLHDPDPEVISNLLHSPHITESFVLKLCSKRPVAGKVLVVVTHHDKWFSRYSVKRALLLNPSLPGQYAHNLMLYLSPKDLGEFSREPTVAEGLRLSAGRLLRGLS